MNKIKKLGFPDLFDFEELQEAKILNPQQLQLVRRAIDEVILMKVADNVTFSSINFWIIIFPSGVMSAITKEESEYLYRVQEKLRQTDPKFAKLLKKFEDAEYEQV